MMTTKSISVSCLTCLAIGLSTWSLFLTHDPKADNATPLASQPDAFMENVTAVLMNQQGKPTLKMTTPKMIHFAKDDSTTLMTPHIIIYRPSMAPWHVDAKHAKTLLGKQQIQLWDNVVIQHERDTENPNTLIQTESLTLFPGKQVVETDQPITLKQPNTLIHAIGMLANMETGTVQLFSKAEGEYVAS